MEQQPSLSIVITGGGTGVARAATRLAAARGHRVTVVTHGPVGASAVRQDGGLPAYGDMTRASEVASLLRMAQAEVVIDLAPQALNSFPLKGVWESGLNGLKAQNAALIQAAQAVGLGFLVATSYAALYGDSHGEWLDEDGEGHADDLFRAALKIERALLQSGLTACVLRAGFNYGPEDAALQQLNATILRGRSVTVGDAHTVTNWVHAADLAAAAVLAAEKQPSGQILNVVDDHPASAAAFAGYLASSQGLMLSTAMAMPAFARNWTTSEIQRALLAASCKLQNGRIKSILGWAPKYPTFQAGLEQALLEWRAKVG